MTKTAEEQLLEGGLTTGNFTVQAQMPQGKTITMSGYIYSKNTLEGISKQVDLYVAVIDRQRSIAEIPQLEAAMEQKVTALNQLVDHANMLKKKQDSGKKLATSEKQQFDNIFVTIDKYREDIEKGRIAIEEAKNKI